MPYKHLSFIDVFSSKDIGGLDLLVEIPMLQRDYAYGRVSEREKRESFLKTIKNYLDSNTTDHEMDFVYGSVNSKVGKDCLIIIDGQQRLTTLFLLHWYLARVCGQYDDFLNLMVYDNKSKFAYTIRDSSTSFCNSLVLNGNSGALQFGGEEGEEKTLLSERIRDEKWFFNHWNNDPTVSNMLNMLDSIELIFKEKECHDYYEKLNKPARHSYITFNFLPFSEYGLTDELYIKMNSRGKSLTRFENLKSKILRELEYFKDTAVYKAKLMKVKMNPEYQHIESLRQYVSLMFDTKWTDVFWNYWLETQNKERTKPCIDDMMLSFISNYCVTNEIIRISNGKLSIVRDSEEHQEIEMLMKYKNNIPYEKLILMLIVDKTNPQLLDLFSDDQRNEIYNSAKSNSSYNSLLFDLIDFFDLISKKDDKWELRTYLDETSFYDEKAYFSKIVYDFLSNGRNYEEKAFFFVYSLYLSNNSDNLDMQLFCDWLRFSYNIIKQTYQLTNGPFNFGTCILALRYLFDSDIYGSLVNKDVSGIVTIDKFQLREEILKAKLYRNDDWKQAICKAEEDLKYFEGQLYYILIDYCNITEKDVWNDLAIENFKRAVERMHSIFNGSEGCSDTMAKALTIALLSLGDYLRKKNQNFSFLKNDDRDISWKRLLKKQEDSGKQFFDEILSANSFDDARPYDSLIRLGKANVNNINEKWRKVIVEQPDVLDVLGSDRFVRWNYQNEKHENKDDNWDNWEIDLLALQRMSGKHYELFSYALYLDIRQDDYTPFSMNYEESSTDKKQPSIRLDGFAGKKGSYCLHLFYSDNDTFVFEFSNVDNEKGVFEDEVISSLEEDGFVCEVTTYLKTVMTNKIKEELQGICNKFSNLLET